MTLPLVASKFVSISYINLEFLNSTTLIRSKAEVTISIVPYTQTAGGSTWGNSTRGKKYLMGPLSCCQVLKQHRLIKAPISD